jgi:hypothetical protein
MEKKKMQKYIVRPQLIEELVHHDIYRMEKGVGPLFKFMDQQMVKESDVTVLVRKVEKEPAQDLIIGPSLHKHEVNQLYCLLGDLELEVTLRDEKHRVKAPTSILVPAGIDHAIRFLKGKGYLVNVLSGAKYR